MSNRKAAGVVATLVLVVGLFFMFANVSVSDDSGVSITCGDAVHADTSFSDLMTTVSFGTADYTAQCHDKLATRKAISFPLVGVGAVGLLFVLLTTDWSKVQTRWSSAE